MSNPSINRQSYWLKFNVYPKENHYLGVNTEWSSNDVFQTNKDYFFSDLTYRYTWKKANLDLELQWNNIFNTKEFTTLTSDSFMYVATNFQLRPSQMLIKIRFSL